MSDKDKPAGPTPSNTGGGAYIGGNVIVGGDFAGRDQFKVVSTQGATSSCGFGGSSSSCCRRPALPNVRDESSTATFKL